MRHKSGDYRRERERITVMTMHASKGLGFPLVAIPERLLSVAAG